MSVWIGAFTVPLTTSTITRPSKFSKNAVRPARYEVDLPYHGAGRALQQPSCRSGAPRAADQEPTAVGRDERLRPGGGCPASRRRASDERRRRRSSPRSPHGDGGSVPARRAARPARHRRPRARARSRSAGDVGRRLVRGERFLDRPAGPIAWRSTARPVRPKAVDPRRSRARRPSAGALARRGSAPPRADPRDRLRCRRRPASRRSTEPFLRVARRASASRS